MPHPASLQSVHGVTVNPDNLFLLWEGVPPEPERLAQINVCLRSVWRHSPAARMHLFSNVIRPEQLNCPEVHVIRWEPADLFAGTPLQGRFPAPGSDWYHWSDLFRIVCLWRWGGSYLDVDDLLIRPLNALPNAMAACFLTGEQAVRWQPAPVIPGCHAARTGSLPASCWFRFGNDPMLNFQPQNPFLEAWLRAIPEASKGDWGQLLPTTLFSSAPEHWRRHVNAVPWADLLYHPYDGGHHPDDQRYSGARLHSDVPVTRREFLLAWPKLRQAYDFPLIKNHDWSCQQAQGSRQSLLHWAVQQVWAANGIPATPSKRLLPASLGSSGPRLVPAVEGPAQSRNGPAKLILQCRLPPGDIVMLTAAVRDLHRSYPGRFLTDIRTDHPQLWAHNPHITPLADVGSGAQVLDCHYPLISQANRLPHHFLGGFIDYLNQKLALDIQLSEFRGDIHLHPEERAMPSPVEECFGFRGPYWLVAAGGKRDFSIKWWDTRRYQQVVDHFRGRIQFVQVGAAGDFHPELDGVLDLRGRTDFRQLIRLVHQAEGVVCPVTSLMHLAAAVPTPETGRLRPCIVIAGGREPVHWEAYPGHQFLHTIGLLPCCATGGCWRARTKPLHDGSHFNQDRFLCVDVVNSLPRCMDMITAADVIRRIEVVLAGKSSFPVAVTGTSPGSAGQNITGGPAVSVSDSHADPKDLLVRHYASLKTFVKATLREDLSSRALTNSSLGLGDTVILTQLPAVAAQQRTQRFVDSDSPHFQPLMRFNRHHLPAQGRVRMDLGVLARRYDLGNGHLTQKIQRAFGLRPAERPAGHIECGSRPVPRKVALHFEPGTYAMWQRTHIHPRARQLYPESQAILQSFIRQHPDWSFVQFGGKAVPLEGVEDAAGLPLDLTIPQLAQCEYFVGIVSGPMHLATALGLKCVVILNFPRADEIMLPTLKHTGLVESDWLYPQNVHLHQEEDAPLVRRLTLRNLERALQGELYPFWSDRFLSLIHERIPDP